MTTVRDLIIDALEDVGVIAAGETPTAADLQACFKSLNRMIDSWTAERLALFSLTREVFELTSGKNVYEFGVDFDSSRPMEIVGAAYGPLRKVPVYETPEPSEGDPNPEPVIIGYKLFVDQEFNANVIDYQKWASIRDKTLSSSYVGCIYPFGSAPFEKIQVYPTPNSQVGLVIYAKKQLDQFDDVESQVQLPPGYENALVCNLVVSIGAKFGKEPSPMQVRSADNSKAAIKRQNMRIPRMSSDAANLSTNSVPKYNILIGGKN